MTGYINGYLPANANALVLTDAAGNPISTAGTTTAGLQEAFNAAFAGKGTQVPDLDIAGCDVSTGAALPLTNSTVIIPPGQGKKARIGAFTLDMIQVDSQMMSDIQFAGAQIFNVFLAPTNPTPLDGAIQIVDTKLEITTIIGSLICSLDKNDGINLTKVVVQEMNAYGREIGLDIPAVGAGQNFAGNRFEINHMHGLAPGGIFARIGTAPAPSGQVLGGGLYDLCIAPDDEGKDPSTIGVVTYGCGDTFFLRTLGLTGTIIHLMPGANYNKIILGTDQVKPKIIDQGIGNKIF